MNEVEEFLASPECANAIRSFGLPIPRGKTGDDVVAWMLTFLRDGAYRYAHPEPAPLDYWADCDCFFHTQKRAGKPWSIS